MKFDHMRSRIISYNYNAFHSPVFSSLFAEEGTGSNVDFIERCIATKSMNLHNVSHKLHEDLIQDVTNHGSSLCIL